MTEPAFRDPNTAWVADYQGLSADAARQRAADDGRPVRIVHPGDMVTMDYLPSRLNICLDDDGGLDRLTAG